MPAQQRKRLTQARDKFRQATEFEFTNTNESDVM